MGAETVTNWAQSLGMNQPNDQFDFGMPGHPCSICQSERQHTHAYRPGDNPQIDTENLKPLKVISTEPAWSHFHAEGSQVIDRRVKAARQQLVDSSGARDRYVGIPAERTRYRMLFKWIGKRTVRVGNTKIEVYQGWTMDYARHGKYVRGSGVPGVAIKEPQIIGRARGRRREWHGVPVRTWLENLENHQHPRISLPHTTSCAICNKPFDYDKYAAIGIDKVDETLWAWVKSQKRLTYAEYVANVEKIGRRQYKTNLHLPGHDDSWAIYDGRNEKGVDEDNGVAIQRAPRKTSKSELGVDSYLGFSPVVPTACSVEFWRDHTSTRNLSFDAIKQAIITLQPYEGLLLDRIAKLPVDAYDRQQQIQHARCLPNYVSFGSSDKDAFVPGESWHYPRVLMVYPVYGYGKFVKRRGPRNLRDPEVTIADECLFWSEFRKACERDGLIWTEKWTVPFCPTCGRNLARLDDPAHQGHHVYPNTQTHSYGHSILYPDKAFKYETFIPDAKYIADADKWQAMVEHEQNSMAANVATLEKICNQGLFIASKYTQQIVEDVLLKRKSPDEGAKLIGVSPAAFKRAMSRFKHMDVKAPIELWKQGLKGQEPGIYIIARFNRRPTAYYRIADLGANDETIAVSFHDRVVDMVDERASKKRLPSVNGTAEQYRKEALRRGFRALSDQELACRLLYEELTSRMLNLRTWPDLVPVGDGTRMAVIWAMVLYLFEAGIGYLLPSPDEDELSSLQSES